MLPGNNYDRFAIVASCDGSNVQLLVSLNGHKRDKVNIQGYGPQPFSPQESSAMYPRAPVAEQWKNWTESNEQDLAGVAANNQFALYVRNKSSGPLKLVERR
jgi:hypothetical protein